MMKIRDLCLVLVVIFIFGVSGAMELEEGCCFLNEDGENCGISDGDKCEAGALFAEGSECSQTAFCEKGCCYDEASGIYDNNVWESACPTSWDSDENCNLPGANLGCCILEDETIFETRGQCEVNTVARALSAVAVVDWNGDLNEVECAMKMATQREGACIFDGGDCKIKTEGLCLSSNGDFYEGKICSATSLNTSCKMTSQTVCSEGKVYFVDSCGNFGNVYDSSRSEDVSYWDEIVDEEEVCGYGSENGNAESASCGNCDLFAGGICSSALADNFEVDVGGFYCKDTSCMFDGERYENGESWCVYDGAIGAGDDVVGSRHWKYVCSQGLVRLEPCADERKEICVQSDSYEVDGNDVDFRSASCVDNYWSECFDFNEDVDAGGEECVNNTDCFIKSVAIDDFGFNMCVPEYPRGFDWTNERAVDTAEEVCGMASQTCRVTYVRDWDFGWVCAQNCNCESQVFTDQMQDLCRGLGDCGAYVNIAGDFTSDGFSVINAPRPADNYESKYISKAEVVEGQVAKGDGNATNLDGALMKVLQGDDINPDDRLEENALAPESSFAQGALPYATSRAIGLDENIAKWTDIGGYYLWDLIFGDTKIVEVSFECKPWSPVVGGDNCESCNGDLFKPCSPYRCHSLGATCELLNEGSGEEICIDGGIDDGNAPIIVGNGDAIGTGEFLSGKLEFSDIRSDGLSLISANGGCLEAYTPLSFGITTDKPSYCKFDIEEKSFENMSYDFGSNLFSYNHEAIFELPDFSHGESNGLDWSADFNFYIKCVDHNGHETPDFFSVDMCLFEGDDTKGPLIRKIDSEDNSFVSFDAVSKNIDVITNELSTCRWSDFDVDYALMDNEMVCDDVLGARSSPYGYVCSAVLGVANSSNVYYIRCMDQPWEEYSYDRNANSQSKVFNLRKPSSKISIGKMAPTGVFEVGTDLTTIELKVATSGGATDHTCYYSYSGYDQMLRILGEASDRTHSLSLNIGAGEKKIYVKCSDETGDFVENFTSFEIVRDSSTPAIARVWQTGGFVNLVLNEEGECRFSLDGCGFAWDEGQDIGSGIELKFGVTHGEKYYIKCGDLLGNFGNGCSVEVFVA